MSDHEDAVERFLRDHAEELERRTTPVTAGEAMHHVVASDLSVRGFGSRSRGGSRRGLALVAAACVAFAGVAGFVAGRASYDPPSQLAAGSEGGDEDLQDKAAAEAGRPVSVFGSMSSGAGGFAVFDDAAMPTFTPVFFRTSAGGVAIRAYFESWGDQVIPMECPPNEWCPPPECSPTTGLVVELSSTEAVMQSWMSAFEATEPLLFLGRADFGFQEGAPVSGWVARTSGDVASVRVTGQDGQVDEMAPVDGWVVLTLAGEHGSAELTALDAAGAVVSTVTAGYEWYQPETCMPPPPSLPEPTGEPPADVAAAEAAVREAYEMVFTAGVDPETRRPYLEDPDSHEAVGAQVRESYPEATDTIQVETGEVRFIDATNAALYFELTYEGGALFGEQIGFAKLIDGRWVIAKDTVCMVLGWGGGVCEGYEGHAVEGGGAPMPPSTVVDE